MEHSFKVATTLAAQRIVFSSADNTVAFPTGITVLPLGVTTDTVNDTTGAIPVKTAGERAKVLFNQTVTVGGIVAADSSGRGIAFAEVTAASGYVGVLIGPQTGTLTIAEILVQPGMASGG